MVSMFTYIQVVFLSDLSNVILHEMKHTQNIVETAVKSIKNNTHIHDRSCS